MKKILQGLMWLVGLLARNQLAFATYNYEIGGPLGEAYGAVHDTFVLERALDFALIAADRSAAGLAAIAAADVIKLISIPAGVMVMAVIANVVKAQGAAFTFGLGDSGSATQYQNATNGNVTGSYAVSGAAAWKVYAAADDLIMTVNQNGINLAQVVVKMVCMRTDVVQNPTQWR